MTSPQRDTADSLAAVARDILADDRRLYLLRFPRRFADGVDGALAVERRRHEPKGAA